MPFTAPSKRNQPTCNRTRQQVKKQIQAGGGKGGRGMVIQDVHAPVAVVMGRILDFGKYNKMVPNVAQCGNYAEKKLRNVSYV